MMLRPTRWRSFVLAIGASLGVVSCGQPTEVIGGQIVAKVTPPVLQLTNKSPAPAYFFPIEGNLAMRANWGPCTDPGSCRNIAPGRSVDLPLDEIAGYHPDAKMIIVYWWHLIPGGPTGFQPDSIRAAGTPL
jgi:hypothetical protein